MNNEGNGWWKHSSVPELDFGVTRQYDYSAIDFNNNPSQSFIYNYTSVDLYNPETTIISIRIS